jgi:hypothetical protein
VTWDAEQLAQLFLAQTLRHARDRNGPGCFSFHGPLRLCDTAHFTVRRLIIKATGLETWARFFLKPFEQPVRKLPCTGCRARHQQVTQAAVVRLVLALLVLVRRARGPPRSRGDPGLHGNRC